MWFKILYFIYLTLAFLFPTITVVGVLSIRHIAMIVMLFVCIGKGVHWDKYMTLYTVFLLFFGISSVLTGYSGVFFTRLMGTFLQVYVVYFSTYILVKEYRGEVLLFYYVLGLGLLNAIVTIGQFYNLSFADRIVAFLGISYEENIASYMERFDVMEGIALQGLVGSVNNGYFLSAIAVLSLYNRKGKITIVNLAMWGVVMIASFLAQERMGFFVALLMSFVVFVYVISNKLKRTGWLFVIIFGVLALSLLPRGIDLLQGGELRYSSEINLSNERGSLARTGWNYFLNNPMGGFFEYESKYPYPHNVFINMFVVGGLFGGIVILILFTMQLMVLGKYLVKILRKQQITFTAFYGLMFLAYTINSLTHNLSIVLGTFEFFLFWSAFEAMREKENNTLIC